MKNILKSKTIGAAIIGGIFLVIAAIIPALLRTEGDSLEVKDSPSSISTINQKGDNSVINNFSSSAEIPKEKPNGILRIFTFSQSPHVVFRDGVPMQKISSDGSVNWTGTSTIILEIAPNYDIYSQY